MDIARWVKEARRKGVLTQEQLGERLNVTKGNVSGWENGRHEPGYAQLVRISEVTGYPLEGTSALVASEPTLQPIYSWQHPDDLPPGEFVMIPRLSVTLSAGGGRDQVEIEFVEKQPQAFRADWIRKMRLKPSKLASMTAVGDSMEDRIHDGDALVIDTSQTSIKDGGVYAMWYEGGERVKRLFNLPGGGLRIHSDNSAKYPDIVLRPEELEHVRIIGRVVHQSGTGGL
jgi:phage repressor protein C with HTH and peptisase S24 domain